MRHSEHHRFQRSGWLRAAVLGANDGICSTASLLLGVAGAGANKNAIVVAGVAGLVAGAMSMAAGEYVSVSSQADTQAADLARERYELAADPAQEHDELARIYVGRGLSPTLAEEVAAQLMARDALAAHARDELGISELQRARPIQATLASAITFAAGAALPLASALFSPAHLLASTVPVASLASLAILGWTAARIGGAPAALGTARVTFWGAFAMAVTYAAGASFGAFV